MFPYHQHDSDDQMQIVSLLNYVRHGTVHGGVTGGDGEGDFGVVGDGDGGQMLEFEMCAFDEEQSTKFQKYLQTQSQKYITPPISTSPNKQNHPINSHPHNPHHHHHPHSHRHPYKPPKKPHYIPKLTTPKTIFNYHGIDIQVLYHKYTNFYSSCLVMPYDRLDWEGLTKLGLGAYVVGNVLRELEDQGVRVGDGVDGKGVEDGVGDVVEVQCGRFWKDWNYRWMYLVKKPVYKYMPEYSADILQKTLQQILQKCWQSRSIQSITIPNFSWLGLNPPKKCQTFFWSLLKTLHHKLSTHKTHLQRITICCGEQQDYFQFVGALREVSDMYVRNGLVEVQDGQDLGDNRSKGNKGNTGNKGNRGNTGNRGR